MALYRGPESMGGASSADTQRQNQTIRFDERDFTGAPRLDLTLSARDAQRITGTEPRQRPPLLYDPDDAIIPKTKAPERAKDAVEQTDRPRKTGESLANAISDAVRDGVVTQEEATEILKAFFREARAITAAARAEWYSSVPEADRMRLQGLIGVKADGKIARSGGGETIGKLRKIAGGQA